MTASPAREGHGRSVGAPLRHLVHAVIRPNRLPRPEPTGSLIAVSVAEVGAIRDDVSAFAETLQVKRVCPGAWYSTPIQTADGGLKYYGLMGLAVGPCGAAP